VDPRTPDLGTDPRRMTPAADSRPVVVVPIYNAPDDVRRCAASVLDRTRGDFRLVLIDDASPDPGVREALREIEQRGDRRIELLANERNLGFTATANRGMMQSGSDVVLLNSDTIVTDGWLDALVRCAASDPRIATVTPFSNNAEIVSFPHFCRDNEWPEGADPQAVQRAIADAAVPTYPDLPTGVGFCMFIRRAAIDDIGTFDMAFGAGYGEENDFCLRAAQAGWRNVLADDAFVVHTGGRSFAGRKAELGSRNLQRLLARHPHYDEMVRRYIAADPLRAIRESAQSRLASLAHPIGVLHVIHHHGGGTETHVRDLIAASRDRCRHYLAVAVGDRWQVEEHRADERVVTFTFERESGEAWRDFVDGLTATFRVSLIHLHNISGCRDGLLEALEHSRVPYGYTLHDLNFACPTITFLDASGRYCGGVTDAATCQRCLDAQPSVAHIDVRSWRSRHAALVAAAAFVIAPSQWASAMLRRYFDRDDVTIIPHGLPPMPVSRTPGMRLGVLMPDDGVPVVAALGAIGPDKGARRIEQLVERIRALDLALRIVVIGYLDVEHGPWQSDDARLTVHGRYEPRDLAAWLAHYRAQFVVFPSAGPETFSYTLSESWRAGVPVVVPPIGALAERVAAVDAGWVLTEREWADDAAMLARIVSLAASDAAAERQRAASNARSAPLATLATMAGQTLERYQAAIAHVQPQPGTPFTNRRIRDALGYREWKPPLDVGSTVADARSPTAAEIAPAGMMTRFARRALAIRATRMGRLLYRMTPTPLIDALKSRLDG
jgi:GT2 family glycosyltransferase/glycosyltransferase involved in cell wall biosynthesis